MPKRRRNKLDRPRALVIGGSVGGLFAANLLRAIGWEVTVFERARGDLAGRGAGLGIHEELFAVMRRIGIRTDRSVGVEVRSHLALDRSGNVLCKVPLRGFASAWDSIYRVLRSAFPAECRRQGMQLERFEQDVRSVTAFFADGSHAEGELLVGADGIGSTVRRLLMPEVEPRYAGYVGWRGVVEEGDAPAALHDLIFHHMAFCFPEGEVAFSVPMAPDDNTSRCGRRCQFVWFRPVDYEAALPHMCTDASGRRHGTSIPSPLIRPELIRDLKESAKARLAPQIAVLVARAAQPILSAIFDLESPRMAFGRVALVGDAAFVARPHAGMGVTKAALDAQGLADALAASGGDVTAALAHYDRERRRFGSLVVERGRRLGAHLEAQRRPRGGLQTILREWGAAGVIDGKPISATLA
jgi:2-polyprenyl-6-methoxyphenol hydroxylase-like FAD-dependent oxidoreductase